MRMRNDCFFAQQYERDMGSGQNARFHDPKKLRRAEIEMGKVIMKDLMWVVPMSLKTTKFDLSL